MVATSLFRLPKVRSLKMVKKNNTMKQIDHLANIAKRLWALAVCSLVLMLSYF